MKIAIQTPPENVSFAELDEVWQAADEFGVDAAFTFDHFVPLSPGQRPGGPDALPGGPQLEGWTTLAALGARTRRLQVGTLVSGLTYRHPVLFAKMAVTLDHITGGRAILGLGAAWHETEHRLYGFDYPPVGERMGRLDEALEICRRLFAEDTVDHDGRYWRLLGAPFDPKPVRESGIPILVGGSGPRLKGIAARHATMFNSFSAPWEWPAVNADLDERLGRVGRAPDDLVRTAFVFADLSGDATAGDALVAQFRANRGGTDDEVRRRVVVGDPDDMIPVLRSYTDAGIDMAILNLRPPYPIEGLRRFVDEVVPALT